MHDAGDGGHGVKAGGRGKKWRDRVADDRGGGEIAVNAAVDDAVDGRVGIDDDAIVRIGLTDRSLELKLDDGAFIVVSAGGLADTGSAAAGDGTEGTVDIAVSNDGGDVFFPAFDFEANVVSDEVERFAKADMAECAFTHGFGEGVGVKPCADLLLEWDAAAGSILDAMAFDGTHIAADGGKGGGKEVHEEARIDASAQQAAAESLGETIKFFRKPDMAEPGIDEFLAGRDNRFAVRKHGAESWGARNQIRACGDDTNIEAGPVGDGFERGKDQARVFEIVYDRRKRLVSHRR